MRIDPADPLTVQMLALNHKHHFLMLGDLRFGQSLEQSKDLHPIAQCPACQLTDDEGMGQHLTAFQEGPKHAVSSAQMLDPNGRVDEGHATRPGRRRLIVLKPGSVPPSLANRCALSRAINASSPMRTSAVFLETPVNRAARRRREGSMLRVVLIVCIMMHDSDIRQAGGRRSN
jgi:hypothetical protein